MNARAIFDVQRPWTEETRQQHIRTVRGLVARSRIAFLLGLLAQAIALLPLLREPKFLQGPDAAQQGLFLGLFVACLGLTMLVRVFENSIRDVLQSLQDDEEPWDPWLESAAARPADFPEVYLYLRAVRNMRRALSRFEARELLGRVHPK